jgi:hypothetical protein
MKYFVITLCLLLSACATTTEKQDASLNQARVCCKSPKEFRYQRLLPGMKKFKIDQHSPVFEFEKGRSYFAAFEIPRDSSRHFRAKSYFNGMFIGQYFDPVFLVLDENYQPITTGSLELQFVDGTMFHDTNAHMQGEFRVDANAKYLVVFTSKFEGMAPVARTQPMGYGYMVGSVPVMGTTSGLNIQLERAPTGTLRIEPIP